MNKLHDDVSSNDQVIARLRSALNEVTAEANDVVTAGGSAHSSLPTGGIGGARWLAIAAATILFFGAATAIVVHRNHQAPATSSPTDPVTAQTPPPPTTTSLPVTGDMWYTLVAQDMNAEPIETTGCCPSVPPPGPNTVLAWAASSGFADGVLLLLVQPTLNGDPVLKFMSYGLSDARAAELQAKVVPGSGLPYVLPDDSMELVGVGTEGLGAQRSQRYSSDLGTVTITVGEYRGQLTPLVLGAGFHPVTIAGWRGYRYADEAGNVHVVWRTPTGSWATLEISSMLADRADGLIAAVHAQVANGDPVTEDTVSQVIDPAVSDQTAVGVTGQLPRFDQSTAVDPAVGMPAPSVVGFDYDGNEIRIDPAEGPQVVMFQAHWCPHCATNLPKVMEWMADGTIPSWLPVTLVSTAESPTAANYPADTWLKDMGWTGRVIRDSNEGDRVAGRVATAYGAPGYPTFVVIGIDGNVLARATGELSQADMEQLLAALPAGPSTLGRLQIPTIDGDWVVVDDSRGTTNSVRPVLVHGSMPTDLIIGDAAKGDASSVIYGNRTTRGAPFFNLDQLAPGDHLTWTSEAGTAEFTVVATSVCPKGDECPTPPGVLMLTTVDPAYTDSGTLMVTALRTS